MDSKLGKLFFCGSLQKISIPWCLTLSIWEKLKFQKFGPEDWVFEQKFQSVFHIIFLVFYRPKLTSNCCETFCGSLSCAPYWNKNIENIERKSVKKKKKEQEHTARTHSKLNCSIPLPLSVLPSFVHILLQWFDFILGISLGQQLGKCFGHLFNIAICF